MKWPNKIILFVTALSIFKVFCRAPRANVMTGLDVLNAENFSRLDGKNVGLVVNAASISSRRIHAVDLFFQVRYVTLAAIFTPEHGFRGQAEAGESVADDHDKKTGCPVYSLYGKTKKPAAEMLRGLDVLIYDIQDVGVRFYTYISTMALCMEAAAENGIEFWVLDRPNPLGGHIVEGPVLKSQHRSFVGLFPIPIRYGLTVGELAQMVNGQHWLKNGVQADLTVVKMHHWQRHFFFDDTGLPWVKPSPNIVHPGTVLLYPGMALLEATNVSEGRGTETPFEVFGAPWLTGASLPANRWTAYVDAEYVEFTPKPIAAMATRPKYKNQRCFGYRLSVTQPDRFKSVVFGIFLLDFLRKNHGENIRLDQNWLNKLSGDDSLFHALTGRRSIEKIVELWQREQENYLQMREKYLLY